MTEDNVQIMTRVLEATTSHKIDEVLNFFFEDAVWEDVAVGIVANGHGEIRKMFENIYASMPDYSTTLTSTMATEERGGAEFVMAGTVLGEYHGQPATGKSFSVRVGSNVQFSQGRVKRWTDYWSWSSLKEQAGLEQDGWRERREVRGRSRPPKPWSPSRWRTDLTLEAAIRTGDLAAAAELLRSGADVNRRGSDGLTPLMIASALGQSQMVDLLLTAGADVLAVEPRMGATALHKAAQSGNADVIGLLLDRGSFINGQSPILGNTPLIDAVLHKHGEVARLLLERGGRTTVRNHWGQTALELAQADGPEAIAGLIEERDAADAERMRALPLIAAIKAGDVGEVERLLASGASVDERAPVTGSLDDDYTPLGVAAREGRADIVRVLLDAGADARRVIGLMRGTSVHEASYFGLADIVRVFAARGERASAPAIELDAQGPYNGFTPLHDAVWHGHMAAAEALVEAGSRLDLRTHAGLTPRELALLYGYDDLARFLAEAEQAGPLDFNDRRTDDD